MNPAIGHREHLKMETTHTHIKYIVKFCTIEGETGKT